jgi:AcrR family transcriptional regulator
MPKPTFFNLPEEKREAICRVALEEFAAHPYGQVSINRIVARSGIAKGSFYQYFEDKKDLLFYLLAQAAKEKMIYLAPVIQNIENYDFFTLLRQIYIKGIEFARAHREYTEIGKRILENKNTPIYRELIKNNISQSYEFFENLLQNAIERDEIRNNINIKLLAYIIASLNTTIVDYYHENVYDDYGEQMITIVDEFIKLLRDGIKRHDFTAKTHGRDAESAAFS